MAKIEKFEDLEIWRLAREICQQIEFLIQNTNLKTNYSLKDQIDRSSGSVMDNIAEGFERNGNREFINFLSIAKGSIGEVKSQSYRAFDKKLISEEQHLKLNEMAELVKNKIGAMMNYLNKCEIKGLKFK
ncbi:MULTISPECIES: four helix bundle protein [Flavobacterium]|jgi:four helix bundle protein|uniref:S23 ribosomal protein n=2 Tax=Flavobacterium TaxID=237 RepID=A5FHM6_FLAJ1|nr:MULTISPECIES: four helix bundle protein [Flavobacterium]ABQ05296.1 S23 ribosomal protein [Flavobacterium johnsoniae UW101]OXE95758.1 four helix bundle protein [Flavobacterium johnsoniae UW101]WQG82902.1 four helix bundle protein [Flavobacterium johnsoniae UW101]SHH20493.1 four helix bundle protein [Flavobacterium defluvii]SHL60810.1 four helix bundle protein [Flavobacterium johnsoniae]